MNASRIPKIKKTRAQAMVEFMLALPILLTLLYGLLETGRLLFIYASTVTAARQAVRYGSATGDSPNGMKYYNDCDGIRAAAQGVGFINRFEDEDIIINYDRNTSQALGGCPLSNEPQNGDRIIVSVSTDWVPIVPLVPLQPFTIQSQSYRTILVSVAIQVTAPAVSAPGSGGGGEIGDGLPLLLSVSASQYNYSFLGEIINFTYLLRNNGTGPMIPPPLIDSAVGTSCPTDTIAAGATYTCTGTLIVSQENMDDGIIQSVAYPLGYEDQAITTTITGNPLPSLALEKTATPMATSRVGRVIEYTFILTNTGNVTLGAPFTVFDDKIPAVDCSEAPLTLPPGSSTVCTGEDVVTEADIDAGEKINIAIATAIYDETTISSNSATLTVLTPPIILEVLAPPIITAPGPAIYTYNIINDTDTPASSVVINDSEVTIDPSCPNFVPANSSVTCTGTYVFTQADIDNGDSLVSTTVVQAEMNSRGVASNPVSITVSIIQTKDLTIEVNAEPRIPPFNVDDEILYTYTLTNTGNVTLKAPYTVTDNVTPITCTYLNDLMPGESHTCEGTLTVTQDHIDAGSIKSQGTATAVFDNKGTPEIVTSNMVAISVPTFEGPRFDIEIAAVLAPGNSLPTIINYTYKLINTGSVELTKPYTIETSLLTDTIDCDLASNTIPPGEETTCTGSYTVIETGTITNTITGASTPEVGSADNLPQSATTIVFICSNSTVTLTHSGNGSSTIVWTITNNSGSALTLSNINISWPTTRRLQSVTFASPTQSIWAGSPGDNSGNASFSGSWSINNGGSATVTLGFNTGTNVSDFTIAFAQPACGGAVFSNP
jgi:uncharacterized repeat protein (TIGR01451 family)